MTTPSATPSDPGKPADPAVAAAAAPVVDPAKPAAAAPAVDPSKPADPAKPGDPAKPADPAAAKPTAPEKYENFTLPEGVKLDDAVMGEFQTLAKTLNLTQADAQKLVDLGARMSQSAGAQIAETVKQARIEWETASRSDKEIGGDQFEANLGRANKVFADYGTPELKQLLAATGLGNHPELVRWAYRVGKALSEDKIVRGNPAANAGQTLEERAAQSLYGKTGS